MDSMNTIFDVIYNEMNDKIFNKVVIYEFNADIIDDIFDSPFKTVDISDIFYDVQRYMNIDVLQYWTVDDEILVVIIKGCRLNSD